MSKVLSLKKHDAVNNNKQKQITQFFKTSQRQCNEESENKLPNTDGSDLKYTKRKASSPSKIQPTIANSHKKCKFEKKDIDFENARKNGSPIKCENEKASQAGSTDKTQEFSLGDKYLDDMFEDDWDHLEIEDNLDLNVMQRCEIISVERHPQKLKLKLQNDNNNKGYCFVEGVWLHTPLEVGEIVSIIASRDDAGQFSVNNTSGLLVLRPDHLISTTNVVAGVFCKRKAVLQERYRGIDSANIAMILGILVHELVQKALMRKISNRNQLGLVADRIIKASIEMLYDAGINEAEARSSLEIYIGPLAEFMQTYVSNKSNMNSGNGKWNGCVDRVLDIEENVCCPQLGLKGKIDATLQVTIHDKGQRQSTTVPLELKSGRASVSAEHRGQLVLYGMMLSLQRQEDPTRAAQKGLLLYLKDGVELHEVSCGYPERQGLAALRNELALHLAPGPRALGDTDHQVDIEDASRQLQQSLPEPVDHHSACSKCAYLTICSLHLWHTDGPKVSETHLLSKLKEESLGHLSLKHIEYFLHWTSLLKLEEKAQMTNSPLHALWTESEEKRSKRGVCAANLKLKNVTSSGDRFLHVFLRELTSTDSLNGSKAASGPQEGEFSIVSIKNRPWIAAGVVTLANNNELRILLERDLSQRLSKQTLFHMDTYESYATTVQNLTNLGVLMEDSDRALKLRKLIIDKEAVSFAKKLPHEVMRLGEERMRALNPQQQHAVRRALAAARLALLRGLPGTGKTQTISVLIEMLVALKQRVLVTAHTHSAVDNVLSRLPKSLKILRLGASCRVAPELAARCEHVLRQSCHTTEQLETFYDSMEVVGVTCLGATHPMISRTMFDVCIVDEATQVLQCTVVRPLFAAHRFVLVGDPEQLPPVIKSKTARRLGMEESLFHRLMSDDTTTTLKLQYRMNKPLVDVANKVAYNNLLKCADEKVAEACLNIDIQKISIKYAKSPWLITACSPEFDNAAIFLNTILTRQSANEKVIANTEEACVVMTLIDILKEGGVLPSDIGVIAPYRDQVSLVRRMLAGKDVEVSTVDQFQGRDKSVIIYSCTRRDEDGRKVKESEVLNDQRRLAVSVTRAKHKFIMVGDLRALRKYKPLLRLIEECKHVEIDHNTIAQLSLKYGSG